MLIADGADTKRFLYALHDLLWRHGLGWHVEDKKGNPLERSLVDRMVFAGERLVFDGASILSPPLHQDKAAREAVVHEGAVLDTLEVCPPPRTDELVKLNQLKRASKKMLEKLVKHRRDRMTQPKEEKLSPTGGGFGEPENVRRMAFDKLASSGISAEAAKRLGITCQGELDTRRNHPWAWKKTPVPALVIRYFDVDGKSLTSTGGVNSPQFFRLRALREPVAPLPIKGETKEKKPFPKYLQRPGSGIHAYFPKVITWSDIVRDPSKYIIFTEGEFKAAKACLEGFPTIGLGGVDSFASKKKGIKFLPELDAITWEGRIVVIIFDSDFDKEDRSGIEAARRRLANQLIVRGAKVAYVDLPHIGEGEKVGLDDFLVHKSARELKALIADAVPMEFDWRASYLGSEESPLNNLTNAAIALRHAPELATCFRYDEMMRGVVVVRALPGTDEEPDARPLTDQDVRLVQEWLQTEGLLTAIGEVTAWSAIQMCAHESSFPPVRDYLDGVKWDKKSRLNSWLRSYLGALGSPSYLRTAGRMFLIGMVARIYSPGCKLDTMLVLEGNQGIRKSTVCEILGGKWFGDALPDLNRAQDVSQYLRGKWVVEVAELAAIAKSENEAFKAFVTRRVEHYRPPYGRELVHEPRQCVLVGSTNGQDYLRDATGARRSWPVKLGNVIDTDRLRADRDQLFAEAVVAYQAGEHWWPSEEAETALFKPQQNARFEVDAWQEPIETWIRNGHTLSSASKVRVEVTLLNILSIALDQTDVTRVGTADTRRIGAIMRRLGWEQDRTKATRFWAPGPEATVKPPTIASGVVVELPRGGRQPSRQTPQRSGKAL